ncbi:AAA family ATPase [Treponema sp.]|uniref:AAA family ATPase n=1 Tax=Treponema sp. TaxID=166 RepID=UPI003FA30E4F
MNIQSELLTSLKAEVRIIQIISYETLRIQAELIHAVEELEYELLIWDRVEGIRRWDEESRCFGEPDGHENPADILNYFIEECSDKTLLLLQDFYPDFTEDKPKIIRTLRNIALNMNGQKTLVLSQPHHQLPKELEKEVQVIELPYPSFADIKAIYSAVCENYHIAEIEPHDELIEAAMGLTTMEAERAFAKAYMQDKELTTAQIPAIIKEKENIIKKSGFLEYYHPAETLADIGGLERLKDWLKKRERGFDKYAKEFGLDTPKGILLLGIPGTGKSLTAKAIGSEWQFPLLRLDMGKIFGGIVGESEQNIRAALGIAEAIAPSILWIDEIEKGMSGISSSGNTDGGTTARVLGTFLTWMQEKTKPVFVVATANNISQLPPELLRKGRVDEIFFVDLPTAKEREMIISIHLKRKNRNPQEFDLKALSKMSKGFSGAELEEAIKEALFQAYDTGEELATEHIKDAITKTFPLAKTMQEVIENMRNWAKARAVMASADTPEQLETNGQEKIPKLKQEQYNNPFI